MNRQSLQADEYDFPYHYLTELRDEGFRSFRDFSWSLSYATALHLVTGELKRLETKTHLDVGCGDGALVRHLARELPNVRIAGIDYDERAIGFAKAFNPSLDFTAGDLTTIDWPARFQTASLVEVLEHIPEQLIPAFVDGIANALEPGGKLIVTVPSVNKPLEYKHEQHFTPESLARALEPNFAVETIFGFERISRLRTMLNRSMRRKGFFVEISALNTWLLQSEIRFRRSDGGDFGRIFLVARRV